MSPTENPEHITLDELKSRWNEVLDRMLDQDRIAWLAFFDARLVEISDGLLTLAFDDVTKLGGGHNFSIARNPKHIALLVQAISEVLGLSLEIREI
jgi:hypothetical protein